MLEKNFLPKNLTNVIIKVLYIENQDITIRKKNGGLYERKKERHGNETMHDTNTSELYHFGVQ